MFLHPSLRLPGSATAPDPALPRLLAGLRVSDDDLLLLATKYLRGALGVDPDNPDENARRFALVEKHFALLYRHARLAERLKLPMIRQCGEGVTYSGGRRGRGLGPKGPQVGNGAALDQGKAADVLLYVEYKAVMP